MMKNIVKNLVALIGISFLGIGIASATPKGDCGDDNVQPINVHSSVTLKVNKET